MADRIEKVLLDYSLTPSFQKTKEGLKALVVDQEMLSKSLLAVNKQAISADKALEGVNRELSVLAREKAVGNLAKNFAAVEAESGSTRTALAELTDQLSILGASDSEIRQVTREIANMADEAQRAANSSQQIKVGGPNALGRASTGLGSIASVASGLGGGAATEGLRLAGDIAGAAEHLPALKESLIALGPAALVAVGGAAAIGLAFNKMNEDLKPVAAVLDATLVANRKYVEFLASGATTESAEERIKELERLAAAEKSIVDNQTQAMETAFKYAQNTSGDFIARLAIAVGDGDDKVAKSTEEAKAALLEYEIEISRLKGTMQDGGFAAADAAEEEKRLAEIRVESTERIIALENQRATALIAFDEQSKQTDEDRALRSSRADEDLKAQLATQSVAHHDRMIAIADQGQQRLEQIKIQGNERLASADEEISKLQESLVDSSTKLAKDRSKIDSDYMASERASYDKFRQAEEKATADYNKARARRLQDLNDDLLDAEEQNSVVAFIAAKRAADKDLKRSAEDADEATKERQKQFDAERAIAEQRRQERLADLNAQAAERRADIQQQIQERQAARAELVNDINEQLAAEKTRIADTQKAEIENYIAQQKRDADARDLRNRRQAEDEALADRRRRDALNKQLNEIDTKISAEKNAAQLVGNAWNDMAIRVGQVIGSLVSSISSVASSSSSSGGSGGGGQAFALGGIINRPTIAKMGERPGYHEGIIPFRPSEGIESAIARLGLGGRSSGYAVNFNAPISVGDGVSEATLRAGLHELAGVVVEAFDRNMRS